MKYYDSEFILDNKKYTELKTKLASFKIKHKTRKYVDCIYITNLPMKSTPYSLEMISNNYTLESLF
jgi:hypothetical protein